MIELMRVISNCEFVRVFLFMIDRYVFIYIYVMRGQGCVEIVRGEM